MTVRRIPGAHGEEIWIEGTGSGDENDPFIPNLGSTITDGTNSLTMTTAGADAESNTSKRIPVVAWLKAFNGLGWDRLVSGIIAVTSTVTGMLNVIPMGRYWSSAQTLSDGQVGQLSFQQTLTVR